MTSTAAVRTGLQLPTLGDNPEISPGSEHSLARDFPGPTLGSTNLSPVLSPTPGSSSLSGGPIKLSSSCPTSGREIVLAQARMAVNETKDITRDDRESNLKESKLAAPTAIES